MVAIVTKHTENFATAPQIDAIDFNDLVAQGYKTVVNNRPDHEDHAQPLAADLAIAAEKAGVTYHHLPVVNGQFTPEQVKAFATILANAQTPVLAFCRSGARAFNLWKLTL